LIHRRRNRNTRETQLEELTQLKTEAERLKKETVELSGEDAAVIG
jgi:hypothetical protein